MDRTGLRHALAHFSETSIFAVKKLLSGENQTQRSGAFKRAAAEVLGPYRDCYKPIQVPNVEVGAPDVTFYMADMKKVICLLAQRCDSFLQLLRQPGVPAVRLEAILAHDECTAGNVLNPLQTQKTLLFYCSFSLLHHTFLSIRSWIPVAAIPHGDLSQCRGGIGAATAAFLRRWDQDGLEVPFDVAPGVRASIQLKAFISDGDSQRAAFSAKGSAGLKPCIFCANVLKRGCAAAETDPNFVTVAEHDMTKFHLYVACELKAALVAWLDRKPSMTKQEIDLRERCLGFRLDMDGIWSCEAARRQLSIDMALNDAMHCYFSTGIINTEIVLLLEQAYKTTKIKTNDLLETMKSAGWCRPGKPTAFSELKRLFGQQLFGEELYKGSAEQTKLLLPLLRWITEAWLQHLPAMKESADCFLALGRCIDKLTFCNAETGWSTLQEAQCNHQRKFAMAYPASIRPKHHHRLHLSRQYERLQMSISCWGIEAAHQSYKKIFSDNFDHLLQPGTDGSYSRHILPRLLLRFIEMCNATPFLPNGFKLLSPFDEAAVEAATGIKDAAVSAKCRTHVMEMKENDILLWGKERDQGGIVRFFLLRSETLFLYMTPLTLRNKTEATRTFCCTAANQFYQWTLLTEPCHPKWQKCDGGTVIVLP